MCGLVAITLMWEHQQRSRRGWYVQYCPWHHCQALFLTRLQIKVKSDAAIEHFTSTGLAFTDGTEVPADVVVFATGFLGNLRDHVASVFGTAISDRCGDCFGLSEEGEILGAFQPLEQPGIYYLGGALGHARYYSRFIALSIKAESLGTPLPVYRE
jgi:hypothetical protein